MYDDKTSIRGLDTGHKINLVHAIIAFLALVLAVYVAFESKMFVPTKTDPCEAIRKEEEKMIQKIAGLTKGREACKDKDSIETYYDLQIPYANAELQNIKDRLKLCTK